MAKKGFAYKPNDADKKFVEEAVMAGIPFEEIADCLKIAVNTLKKHFKYELMVSQKRLCGKAARCLSEAIDSGSIDAAKFVLARKMGWVENVDLTTKGQKICESEKVDLSGITTNELQTLLIIAERNKASSEES